MSSICHCWVDLGNYFDSHWIITMYIEFHLLNSFDMFAWASIVINGLILLSALDRNWTNVWHIWVSLLLVGWLCSLLSTPIKFTVSFLGSPAHCLFMLRFLTVPFRDDVIVPSLLPIYVIGIYVSIQLPQCHYIVNVIILAMLSCCFCH